MKLLEYDIDDKLYESNFTLVYRAKRKSDKQFVILKILNEEYPSNNQLTRFRYEYEILKMFNSEKVIKVYSIEKIENSVAIIEEDFKGQSLNLYDYQLFSLEVILKLFLKTLECIGEIHSHSIIHKDISPSSILWNSHTDEVKIIDFGIATKLLHEKSEIININKLEGKLAYISPEQTGRMNRNVDYRSDFYSLGATFYEILTNKQPFINAKDEIELIYCHLAKEPIAPHEIDSKIPIVVSKIIQKLMSKNAEDRYQSIFGLKADLEECLNQLIKKGFIDDFSLCKKDQLDRFQIPQKLYGRNKDIEILMKSFENIYNGKNELILVSGFSGIGKSALINEIHRPIIKQKGYFISGKYDQFQKDIPYRAIINGFRELIQQLLTESNEKIIFWKESFKKNLGLNGQIIVDIIPELELIIGKQESVPVLPPNESQNRFNLVFQNFIHTLATKNHPLVIFLDDLQWADNSSLKLIETLLFSQEAKYLLIIGAYRDNEVTEIHPLNLTINNIKNEGILINRIKLEPLKIESINELIMDSLNCNTEKGYSLAKLIFAKTEGNPFFISEFLNFLYTENLITFDYNLLSWKWELKKIQDMGVTDNIIDLMTQKIKKLSSQAQEILKFSACIGNTFDVNSLSIVCQKPKAEIVSDLWEILESFMIFPINDSYKYVTNLAELNMVYKFSHDRIQQAAYSLISDKEKKEFHLKIGELLVANLSKEEQLDQVFDIVNHLNFAKDLINTEVKFVELAYFNLIASQKSKKSIAYTSAFNYIKTSIQLLEKINCEKKYNLCIKFYLEGTEISYLNGEFEYAEQLGNIALTKAKTLLEKAEIYEVLVRTYLAKNNPIIAIKTALKALNMLGVNINENPSDLEIGEELLKVQALLKEKSIENLIKLPKMENLEKLSIMKIISTVMPITYVARPTLVPMLAFSMVEISVNFGNSPASAFGYATYGLILCGTVGDIDSGYQFGELALNLLEYLNDKEFKSRTYFYVYLFISHWKQHLKNSLGPALEAYKIGLETGDIANSALNAMLYGHHAYIAGQELSLVASQMKEYSNTMSKLKQNFALDYNELYRYAVMSWIEQNEDNKKPFYEEYYQKVLPSLEESQNISAIWIIYLNKTIFNYVLENFEEAYKNSVQAEKYISGANGAITPPLFYLYDSLVNLVIYPKMKKQEQVNIMEKVEQNQKKLKNASEYAPMNFLHKWLLVEAEKERVLGNDQEAERYYDEAIDLAQKNDYINEEALAYELATRYYLEKNKTRIASYYLWESIYAYQRWGAIVKVNSLRNKYIDILSQFSMKHIKSDITNSGAFSMTTNTELDLESVLKASQTISNEMDIQRLLEKIMSIAVENIGAQTGIYISVNKEHLSVLIEQKQNSQCKYLIATPIDKYQNFSKNIINYVARTFNDVVYYDASSAKENLNDEYIQKNSTKSLLCLCIKRNNELKGILYFENNLSKGVFTKDRINFLKMLLGQMNISLENASLYNELKIKNEKLESEVAERTKELTILNKELENNNNKLTEAYIKLEEIAKTDPLTKLLNRRSMLENLEAEVENFKNNNLLFSVLIMDIDNFKQFNDNYGHDCGDFVLKSASDKIKSVLEPETSLARWGGEEFLVLLPNCQIDKARETAENIRNIIINSNFTFNNLLELKITLTIGISTYEFNDLSIDDVIKRADKALYLGKNSGKNKITNL